MGCDIHLVVEKRRRNKKMQTIEFEDGSKKEICIDKAKTWWPCLLTLSPSYVERIYGVFACLANVRNYYGEDYKPLELKGFPEDASYVSKEAYYRYIIAPDTMSEEKIEEYNEKYDYFYITRGKADKFVNEYGSVRWTTSSGVERVSSPDWHSPSYCSVQEMEDALDQVFHFKEGKWEGDYIEWIGLLYYMKGVEASGEYECRAVFWFDN